MGLRGRVGYGATLLGFATEVLNLVPLGMPKVSGSAGDRPAIGRFAFTADMARVSATGGQLLLQSVPVGDMGRLHISKHAKQVPR